ncbi:S8/S53 family peptidase [Burkholderia gladioli]|uniref:S8 family peptidase n=1 Tax=Burkholderia gladioli TaxID=28095 RepID=UPI000BF11550|nr:S8/S53 family peptidase [Burkholderia gladioli]MBU9197937.1 S8/S53 family peptidase [Burkholderia gladioli]PEH81024.1 serine peptidase [Burkholderia gladioli]
MKAPVTVCLLDSGLLRHSEAARRLCGGIDLSDEGGLFARCNEHGTRVAETVLAQCPQARLALVRIVDENGWLRSTEAIEAGFAWVLERLPELGPSVICAAFGDMFHYRADTLFEDSALRRTIAALRGAGVLTVAAAGNLYPRFREAQQQGMAWPAILRETVSVGALDGDPLAGTPLGVKWSSQRLHPSFGSGCATTLFAQPGPPGDTSGAVAVVVGQLAGLLQTDPDAGADVLLERLMARTGLVPDAVTGLTWPALLPDTPCKRGVPDPAHPEHEVKEFRE